ncbi:DUF1566 domain-containing protein, partial [Aliarcobacter butzleri]|uniref:DUF1566 domain-containing protein n=1 Tax=Aliarcobacter butzleri TaxID=28197 RepID=UPI001D00C1F2
NSGTNNLVDGIPTTNAYLDSNAISVGYAIQSGIVLQKCGNYWCRINTSQVVNSSLVNSTSSNVVSLIETYQYNNCSSWTTQQKGLTKLSSSCAVAGNGLMYDNCEGGSRTWINASSYCSSKGMRLPVLSETRASNGSGVPSCSYFWTWTSTNYKSGYLHVWHDTSDGSSNGNDDTSYYVRCVK